MSVPKRFTHLALAAMLCLTVSSVGAESKKQPSSKAAPATKTTKAEKRPHVSELGAVWCVPCKKLAPIIEHQKSVWGAKVDFETLDFDQPDGKAFAKKYNAISVPMIFIFDAAGKETYRHDGLIDEQTLSAEIAKVAH